MQFKGSEGINKSIIFLDNKEVNEFVRYVQSEGYDRFSLSKTCYVEVGVME